MTIIFSSLFGDLTGKLKRAQEAQRLLKRSELRFAVLISENRSLHVLPSAGVYHSMPLFATFHPVTSIASTFTSSLQNDGVIPS